MKGLRSGDFGRFLPERLKSLLHFRKLLIKDFSQKSLVDVDNMKAYNSNIAFVE